MTFSANFIAATLIAIMCVCGALFDILGGKQQGRYPPLPNVIRWEIRVAVAILLGRSVDLYSMAAPAPLRLGEMNFWALASSVILVVLVVSLTAHALTMRLPSRAWDRLRFARETMRHDPEAVPMMVSRAEVTKINRALGQPTTGAMAGPDEVNHEGPRLERMRERAKHR